MGKYDDIIHLSRPESAHPKMRRQDRAKLFAPFAALSGHEEAVRAREQAHRLQTEMAERSGDAVTE